MLLRGGAFGCVLAGKWDFGVQGVTVLVFGELGVLGFWAFGFRLLGLGVWALGFWV